MSIIIGCSSPYFGIYTANEENSTYTISNTYSFGRGVNVSVSIQTDDQFEYYNTDGLKEKTPPQFTSGQLTMEVDGLSLENRNRLYNNYSYSESGTFLLMGDKVYSQPPYVAVCFVMKRINNGVITYLPVVIPKVKFIPEAPDSATSTEEVSWTTETLTADIYPFHLLNTETSVDVWLWRFSVRPNTSEEDALAEARQILLNLSYEG